MNFFFCTSSSPAGASLQLVPNSKFSLHPPHSTTTHCPPLFWRGGTGVRTPLAQACSLYPNPPLSHPCATPFGKLSEFVKVFSVNLFQDMTISPYFSSSLLLGLFISSTITIFTFSMPILSIF